MRPLGRDKILLRIAFAVVFGVMSLGHGTVMAFAASSVPNHEIGATPHASHQHHVPQEKTPNCYALMCCVAVAPSPTGTPVLLLLSVAQFPASPNLPIVGINPAPAEPPPRLQT